MDTSGWTEELAVAVDQALAPVEAELRAATARWLGYEDLAWLGWDRSGSMSRHPSGRERRSEGGAP